MSSPGKTSLCHLQSPSQSNLNALPSPPSPSELYSPSLPKCGLSAPYLPISHASTDHSPHHIWLYPQAPAPMPLHRRWPGSHRLKPHTHDPNSPSPCDHCPSDASPNVGVILPGAGAPLMPPGTAGADMADRWERADADAAAAHEAAAAAAAAAAATTGSVAAVAAPAWAQFLCGSLSGCAAEAATLPLELTKVGRQLSHSPTTLPPPAIAPAIAATAAGVAAAATTSSAVVPPAAAVAAAAATAAHSTKAGKVPWWTRTPILNQLIAVARAEGIGGLYRGLFPALMRQFAKAGLQMSLFREIKRLTCSNPARPTAGEQMAASIAAAVTGQLVANPLDVLKVRLMASVAAPETSTLSSATTTRVKGAWMPHRWRVWPLLGSILANEGVRGLYRGASAGAARSALSSGTGLGVYAATKQFVTAPEGKLRWKDSLGTHVVVSAVSALVSTVASAPADTVKTRLMNQRLAAAAAASAGKSERLIYNGAIDCVVKTVKNEGMRALYRGVGPNFIRVVPWQIVFFATYESLAPRLIGDGL